MFAQGWTGQLTKYFLTLLYSEAALVGSHYYHRMDKEIETLHDLPKMGQVNEVKAFTWTYFFWPRTQHSPPHPPICPPTPPTPGSTDQELPPLLTLVHSSFAWALKVRVSRLSFPTNPRIHGRLGLMPCLLSSSRAFPPTECLKKYWPWQLD